VTPNRDRRGCFVLLLWLAAARAAGAAEPSVLALTHATVIDCTGRPAQPDVTVVVSDGRITAMGRSGDLHPPTNAVVVDATGKYLIPGLWDMHVHWYDKDYLPLFLANGVTGIRLMLGAPMHHEWRREIEAGKLAGPRLFIASPIVDGPKPVWPGSITAGSASEGRQAVLKVKQDGADFVKVYSVLPREAYFAIADETKKQGISFAGHVPIGVSVEEASAAGQKSIEHLSGILTGCSSEEARLLESERASFAGLMATNDPISALTEVRRQGALALETYSQPKAEALFALLKSNHTWQCPTLVVLRNIRYEDEASVTNDSRVKYLPRAIRGSWEPSLDFRLKTRTREDVALGKRVYPKEIEIVGAMQRAGVEMLAGTDTLNPYCFPGFSLHDELGLLVQAGLTPMQALQAATRNAARFMGREQELGTIEPGKVADMVLLDANPLEAIGNTRKISALVYGGRLFGRPALDEMLYRVEALADKSKTPIAFALLKTIEERGIDAAVRQYHELKSEQSTVYDFSEEDLNSLGYELIGMKQLREAVEILRLNAEAYPQSANVYDSLGEAYLKAGDKQRSIENYEKSLKLDPNNAGAVEKLREMKAEGTGKSAEIEPNKAGAEEKVKKPAPQGAARPVSSIRLVLRERSDPAVENIVRIFARQVSERCGARTITSGSAAETGEENRGIRETGSERIATKRHEKARKGNCC
jgi:imidazolonepropionase-like amidohydrolase